MAEELGSSCLGTAATQSDYIGYWVDGQFMDAILCPFADSFTLGTVPSAAFGILLLGGLLVYLAITNESFVLIALLGILLSGFIFQVIQFGPLIEAWFLIVIFFGVGAVYTLLKKWSGGN